MTEPPRCTGVTRQGQPCKARPKHGHDKCTAHLGTAGRKSLLTADLHHNIVALIRNGNYRATAARAMGMSEATFYGWMERGEADREQDVDTAYRALFEARARAKAEAQAVRIQRLELAARNGDTKVDMWLLERMYPDQFGQRARFEHEHAGRVRSEVVKVPDDAER
jgi:hypothetical protein